MTYAGARQSNFFFCVKFRENSCVLVIFRQKYICLKRILIYEIQNSTQEIRKFREVLKITKFVILKSKFRGKITDRVKPFFSSFNLIHFVGKSIENTPDGVD